MTCVANPRGAWMLYCMAVNMFCRRISSFMYQQLALTPFPDCIRNNQRGRLNIYELHTELVRIQSRLSP